MDKFTLSIGMIVKNEEKYMERCLDSIKPLLENIKCELIIVDTGSTDKTVEIAKRYTDKIYHFDWINDFSAARNFGLEKCIGEWFLYTDADTIFDSDMSEMIEFFTNKDINKNFNSATYVTRNYYNPSHIEYAEHHEHRITRITEDLKFCGSIHEHLNCGDDKIKMLSTFSHHYGYSFANILEAEEKSKRNSLLLEKELEKNPNDLRYLCLLFDTTLVHEKKITIIGKALSVAKKIPQAFTPSCYLRAIKFFSDFDYEKAIEYSDEYILRIKKHNATLVDVYYYRGTIFEKLFKYEKAMENFSKCMEYQKLYDLDKLNKKDLTYVTLYNIGKNSVFDVFNHLVYCTINNNQIIEAFNLWKKEHVNFKFIEALDILNRAILVGNDYSQLGDIYESLINDKNTPKEKIKAFEVFLENVLYTAKNKEGFIKSLAGSGSGDFVKLIDLMLLDGTDKLPFEMSSFLENFEWRSGFSEIIYLCLKNKIDIKDIISKLNFDIIREQLELLSTYHNDFGRLVFENCPISEFFNNIGETFWLKNALEAIILTSIKETDENTRLLIYKDYVNILVVYVTNVYNSDFLNDNDIGYLPETHRLGYFMALAQKSLDEGDKLGYIKNLKKALSGCEIAKDLITALLEDFIK